VDGIIAGTRAAPQSLTAAVTAVEELLADRVGQWTNGGARGEGWVTVGASSRPGERTPPGGSGSWGASMDPVLLTLAGTAGTSLVGLLVAEGWQQTRDGVVTVWRRFRPGAAEDVERELEASRTAALDAGEGDGQDPAGRLEGQWIGRFAALLGEHPEAADELRGLVEEWQRRADGGQQIRGDVRMEARAEGDARIYQAARDQHITER